ncbi:hypothetical protein BLA29_010567 [Euroglyphus maynei]|uniref:Uncharacterized protein n=1 Tax=Euroglyphus maynei TaxID=6958 RepID=A0A1Y3BBX7_EURMA|nr:hypothetical protein BLA29_010567 [Euroglyphus maynei]
MSNTNIRKVLIGILLSNSKIHNEYYLHLYIAGGSGFIGSVLKQQLQKHGFETCIVSRMPRPDSITWVSVIMNHFLKFQLFRNLN